MSEKTSLTLIELDKICELFLKIKKNMVLSNKEKY